MSAELVPSEGSEGRSVPGLTSWLSFLCVSLYCLPSVCLCITSLFKVHQSCWIQTHPNELFNLSTSVTTLSLIKVTFWDTGVRTSTYEFLLMCWVGGHNSTNNIRQISYRSHTSSCALDLLFIVTGLFLLPLLSLSILFNLLIAVNIVTFQVGLLTGVSVRSVKHSAASNLISQVTVTAAL